MKTIHHSARGGWRLRLSCLFLISIASAAIADDDYDPSTKPDCHSWDASSQSWVPYPNETCTPSALAAPPPTDNDFPYTESSYWEEDTYDMHGGWAGVESWKALATGTRNQKDEYKLNPDPPTERQSGCGGPLNISLTLASGEHSISVTFTWRMFTMGYSYTFPSVSETIQVFDFASQKCLRYFGKYALLYKKTTITLSGTISEYKEDMLNGGWELRSGPHPFYASSDTGWVVDGYRSSSCSAKCSS